MFPSNTQQIALPAAGTSAKAHTSKVPASRSREPTARYKWLITQPRAEFAAIRMEHLAAHPTVKPVSLVANALLDCTARGDVVLDQFAGSGTTLLAAEKVGRKAFGIEYEPRYVDVAIERW